MRKLMSLITLCLMTGHLSAADSNLIDRLFKQDEVNQELVSSGLSSAGSPKMNATVSDDKLNPGKVLMLSAIVPGAGTGATGGIVGGKMVCLPGVAGLACTLFDGLLFFASQCRHLVESTR